MNLVKWFRKNNKKIMAVVVIVIMFGFIGGTALQRFLQGGRGGLHRTVAYFGENREITHYDLVLAQHELEILKTMQVDVMLRSIPERIFRVPDLRALLLGQLLFSDRSISPLIMGHTKRMIRNNEYRISSKQLNDIFRRSVASNVYWLLLKKEAEFAGLRISNDYSARYYAQAVLPEIAEGARYSQVVGAIVNRLGASEDEILTTFSKLLAVLEYARMVCSSEDVTAKQIRHDISWGGETINVEFVRFNSSVFAETEDEPTEQEILAHFDRHKKFFAGSVSEENPYGFGYKLPNRVRLEYITVKLDDVSEAVTPPTPEEAEEYYQRYRDRFTEQVLSDPNDANSPLTERTKSFGEVASEISNLLLRNNINSKAELIMQDAKALTEAGLEDIDVEAPSLSTEEFRQMAGDYVTAAEQLSEKHKVRVYAGQTGLLSAADMQADEYLGKLYMRGYGYNPVGLTQIVFAVDELGASELGPFDVPKPRMYENIGPLKDVRGQIMMDVGGQITAVVRVTEAKKASEPESIDQTFSKATLNLEPPEEETGTDIYLVREKVVEDLKRLAAMDTTKSKAEDFVDTATKKGWDEAVDRFNKLYGKAEPNESDPNVTETQDTTGNIGEPFKMQNLTDLRRISSRGLGILAVQNAGNPVAKSSIEMAKKEGKLRDALYSLVPQDSNTVSAVPLVLEFKPDLSYYCAKNISVKRIYQDEYDEIKTMQAYKEEVVQSQSLAAVHFNPENILKRMDFRWDEENEQATDANAPAESEETS
jgi:hypothetical protein